MLTNFRNLFSPYGNVPSSSSARSGPCSSSRASTKRRFQPYKVRTHEFFFLSNQQQERVPSKAEKLQLQEYGLHRKKIVFGSKDGVAAVKRKLESTYPKLVEGGGGGNNPLHNQVPGRLYLNSLTVPASQTRRVVVLMCED